MTFFLAHYVMGHGVPCAIPHFFIFLTYTRRGFTIELPTEKFEVMGDLVMERVEALKVVTVSEHLIG